MRRLALLLPLVVAACVDGRDVATEVTNNSSAAPRISIRNDYHERLLGLSVMNQRLALLRAIRQTGNRCRRVDNGGYQEEYRNMRMWVAACGVEQKMWQIFIGANGDVQVRDCAEAGDLNLPRCRPLPPPAPVPAFDAPAVNINEPIPTGNRSR